MGIIKERLNQAKANKNNNLKLFTWKGEKVKVGNNFVQEEIKLIDATPEQLQSFYDHCYTMLHNTSNDYPGRYVVLETVKDQYKRCNVELCLRELESREEGSISRHQLNAFIHELLEDNPNCNIKDLTFGDVSNVSEEYADLPLKLVIDGCMDQLGVFNRKHLKLTFLTKQGVWLSESEKKMFKDDLEYCDSSICTITDLIKDRLNINENIDLHISKTGLTFIQLRAMMQLKNKKYSELTTDQLKTLRNRILFKLLNEIRTHISQWENRMDKIKLVAEFKKIDLK